MRTLTLATVLALAFAASAHAEADWKQVEQVLGREVAGQPGGVHRFSLPRSDLKVTVDGIAIKPALALGSWLAFKEMNGRAMVMGDLVLTEPEIGPVMSRLAEGGIEITALHNHLLRAQPATFYMHVEGHGDPVKLAQTLRLALEQSRTPLTLAPAAAEQKGPELDTAALERVLGRKGKTSGGVYQLSIPRAEMVSANGTEVPASMGTAIAINFQPLDDGRAATTGDFVLRAEEVNPVLRALREHGLEVTAIHNHMLQDEPRLFFMHFWGVDEAGKLAEGLKAALDKVHVARS
ncbi:DUF1259 domain-containing protein [Benzoatithermus flavus]|uniref:DUF1259 domain-containing protein n=1 Tax=Benzoatithermus flavus TaxID=3108223 RepID=A0ABU8XMC9_9PROT